MPRDTAGLGSSPFDRLYWGNRYYFLLLPLLRCFSSRRSPHALRDGGIAPAGLPPSDIRGSKGICPSPRLFAACHVLPRLREPRHPPCALVYVPYSFNQRQVPSCLASFVPTHSKRSFALLFVLSFSLQEALGPYLASIMSLCSSWWRITDSNR